MPDLRPRLAPLAMIGVWTDRTLACLEGLGAAQLNWRPPVPEGSGSNSLWVLAVHSVAQAEENVLEVLGGQPVGRQREEEFRATAADAGALRARWEASKARMRAVLEALPEEEWQRVRQHPRRNVPMAGPEVLALALGHAGEHAGHAELTLQLLKASGV